MFVIGAPGVSFNDAVLLGKMFRTDGTSLDPDGEKFLATLPRTFFTDKLNSRAFQLKLFNKLDPFLSRFIGLGMNNWVLSLMNNTPEGILTYQAQLEHVCNRVAAVSKQSFESMVEVVKIDSEEALSDVYRFWLSGLIGDKITRLFLEAYPETIPVYSPTKPPFSV